MTSPNVEQIMARIRSEIARKNNGSQNQPLITFPPLKPLLLLDPNEVAEFSKTARASVGSELAVQLNQSSPVATSGLLVQVTPQTVPIVAQSTYRLEELFALRNDDFLPNAYRAILHREADPTGLTYYQSQLNTGKKSRLRVIGEMRYSTEGRKLGVHIPGLAQRFVVEMFACIPFVGGVFQWIRAVAGLPKLVRAVEQIADDRARTAVSDRAEYSIHFVQLADQLDVVMQSIAAVASNLEKQIDASTDVTCRSFVQTSNAHAKQVNDVLSPLQLLANDLNSVLTRVDALRETVLPRLLDIDRNGEALAALSGRVDSQVNALSNEITMKVDGLTATLNEQQQWLSEHQSVVAATNFKVDANIAHAETLTADGNVMREHLDSLSRKLLAQVDQVNSFPLALAALEMRHSQGAVINAEAESNLKAELHIHQEALAKVRGELIAIGDTAANERASVQQLRPAVDLLTAGLTKSVKDLAQQKLGLLDQERRINLLLEEARRRLPEPMQQDQIAAMVAEADHTLDAFYVSFEDQFRGTREDIKGRVSVYIPYLLEAKAGTKSAPIIDIGCGRGELLEVLKDAGLEAKGIDQNRVMIQQCRERDFDVTEADALAYLQGLKANSVGAITGIHIIEHIPFRKLVALFDAAFRCLKPGGIVIFETPNPENILVGSCNFYYDPTHLNPLPPESIKYVVEARGFAKATLLRLHENRLQIAAGSPASEFALSRFTSAQDYAVIGVKA